MKITINYDFTQKAVMGNNEVFVMPDGRTLGEFLAIVDKQIVKVCKQHSIPDDKLKILNGTELNGCMLMVNRKAPENIMTDRLNDGDIIDLVYGFCGG